MYVHTQCVHHRYSQYADEQQSVQGGDVGRTMDRAAALFLATLYFSFDETAVKHALRSFQVLSTFLLVGFLIRFGIAETSIVYARGLGGALYQRCLQCNSASFQFPFQFFAGRIPSGQAFFPQHPSFFPE